MPIRADIGSYRGYRWTTLVATTATILGYVLICIDGITVLNQLAMLCLTIAGILQLLRWRGAAAHYRAMVQNDIASQIGTLITQKNSGLLQVREKPSAILEEAIREVKR